jgi:hypothetical protein
MALAPERGAMRQSGGMCAPRLWAVTTAVIVILLSGGVVATISPGVARSQMLAQAGVDSDSDDFSDRMEEYTGSIPTNPRSTPEHSLFPSSCSDGLDNDEDGLIDADDPGCQLQFEPDQLLVAFRPGTPENVIDATIIRLQSSVIEHFEFVGIHWLAINSGAPLAVVMEEYLALLEVISAEPNIHGELDAHLTEPNDTNYRVQQWNLSNHGDQRTPSVIDADIDAPQAWEHLVDCRSLDATGVAQVVVAVIDTGVDAAHPDLAPVLVGNVVMPGVGGGLADNIGHGTFMGGIIGAVGNNGGVGGGTTGICWSSAIYSVKVFNLPPFALAPVIAGVNHVVAVAGAPGGPAIRTINMSLGFGGMSPALTMAVAAANTAGMLVVASAGNDGGDRVVNRRDPCGIPQPNVICVASSTESDTICPNSGRGSPTVKLAAPGNNIVGLAATGNPLGMTILPGTGGQVGLVPVCGTSPAAAHVTGAATHAWALFARAGLGPTVATVTAALQAAVDPRPGITSNPASAPNVLWGRNNDGRLRMLMGDDFGDAPDPFTGPGRFPTLLASNGARHRDIGDEWFGDGPPFRSVRDNGDGQPRLHTLEVSPEFDANVTVPLDADGPMNLVNNDFHDDGIVIIGPVFGFGVVFFQACTENHQVVDAEFGRYLGGPSPALGVPPRVLVNDRAIYVNGFFDWNRDGDWDDALEYAFSVRFLPPAPVAGAMGAATCHGFIPQVFRAPFVLPPGQIWSRFRIDYGEDVQHGGAGNAPVFHVGHAAPPAARYDASPTLNRTRGQAQYGEVEDYVRARRVSKKLDRLHIVGPVPNRVPAGTEVSIAAKVQLGSDGVPAQAVVFSSLVGSFTFTSGITSPDGTQAMVFTDSAGAAEITLMAHAPGEALIRVDVVDSRLSAFSFLVAE